MDKVTKSRKREWLERYLPAELLGTLLALAVAWVTYSNTHSYIAAAGAGWAGEGIGFYGYFITTELLKSGRNFRHHNLIKRVTFAVAQASTNLLVEFAPAEILDGFIIRPLFMFIFPQFVHPYPLGFLAGKFSADIIFYALAIAGYEAKKKLLKN